MKNSKVIYRSHAVRRMYERKITETEVLKILEQGKDIENYPEDQPYPSRLILGFVDLRPIHIVVADALDISETIVITVYQPDIEKWEPGFEKRRKE